MAIFVFLTACSQGSNVSTPTTTIDPVTAESSLDHEVLFGIWDISIDPDTYEAEIVQSRTASFTANITRLIQPPAYPVNLVSVTVNVPESDLLNGKLVFDLGLSHPLLNNFGFRAFDCRGIIMSSGNMVGLHDPTMHYPSSTQTHMINPDGYTRWWNQSEFTTVNTLFGYTEGAYANHAFVSKSTLNPYKLHTPSLSPGQPIYQMDLSQRATFPVSTAPLVRTYKMQFDITQTPKFAFKYAFSASWSLPNPAYAPNYPIEAFDKDANCHEAYYVHVDEYEEIPYYVDQYVGGGDLKFLLTIGDWQATGGNVKNEISHVWIESPTLFSPPVDVKNTMEFVESTHATMATYRIFLEDMLPTGLEGQQLLITVESANPVNYAGPVPYVYPAAPLAAFCLTDVPITNLQPEGEYAYVYFIPDWCATMRDQCTQNQSGQSNTSGNQPLMANMMKQDINGYYNDYTHVQVWEGKFGGTSSQDSTAFANTCASLGYTMSRTYNDYFDPTNCRVVIVVGLSIPLGSPDPPFTIEEAHDMQEFIQNGGILIFMCEASQYFYVQGFDQLFEWLGMLMQYGGGATPEMSDGFTTNIQAHWLTQGVNLYHYFTCGQWLTQDPFVLTLISTMNDEKLILVYPLPLD